MADSVRLHGDVLPSKMKACEERVSIAFRVRVAAHDGTRSLQGNLGLFSPHIQQDDPVLKLHEAVAQAKPVFSTYSGRRINGGIADWLGRMIVSGAIAEDAQVPTELEFVREAGVSRGAYREALRLVGSKGMLVTRTRLGTRVASRENWTLLDGDVVRWFFEAGTPPDWFISALYELRAMVEPQAASYAAQRRTDKDISAFRRALDEMRSCDITEDSWHAADAGFHRTLLRASGNPVLATLEAGICAAVAFTTAWRYRDMPTPHTTNPVDEHEAVFERILYRDHEGAHRLMSQLVDTALLDTSGRTALDLRGRVIP